MSDASSGVRIARYAPGSHRLIVVGNCAVLLPGTVSDDELGEVWVAAAARLPLVPLARVVLDHLEQMPSLAVAVLTGADKASLLLRGSARALTPSVVVDSGGASLWHEAVVDVDSLVLELDEGEWTPALPIEGGIVAAGAVTWVPRPAETGTDEPHPAPALDRAEPARPASGGAAIGPEATRLENTLISTDELPAEERTAAFVDEAPEDERGVAEPMSAAADAEASELGDPVDSYDRLFAATSHYATARPGPEAAPPVAAAADFWAPATASPVPDPPAPLQAPEAAPKEPDHEAIPSKPSGSSRGLIDSVPGSGSRSADPKALEPKGPAVVPATAAATSIGSQDDEGLTIARSALPQRTSAVNVQGVLCVAGHPNPAEAATCRICRADVPEQSSSTMPRPPLGALVGVDLPAGAPRRIPLRGPMILGRRPQADGLTGGIPELVVVDSPDKDLSRNHVRVTIDGWHVLVTDLGSTNGTVVEEPGRSPERIHPERPTMITPGTRLVLAEVATYVYEVES